MFKACAGMCTEMLGAAVTRIPPMVHGTQHYPLTATETKRISAAVELMLRTRCPNAVAEMGDIAMLSIAIGGVWFLREKAARQELAEREENGAPPGVSAA